MVGCHDLRDHRFRHNQPEEVEDYKRFVLALVDRVAKRHEEHGTAISPNERSAIDEIAGALGATPA